MTVESVTEEAAAGPRTQNPPPAPTGEELLLNVESLTSTLLFVPYPNTAPPPSSSDVLPETVVLVTRTLASTLAK